MWVGWGADFHVHVHTASTLTSNVGSCQKELGKGPRRLVEEDRHGFATADELGRGKQNLRFADRCVLKTETL